MKLPEHEKQALEALYLHYAVATDQLRRNPAVLGRITAAFNRVTGHDFDAGTLLRYMINRRKNKDWPTLGDRARRFEPVTDQLTDTQLEILRDIYVTMDIPSDEFLFRPDLIRAIEQQFATRAGVVIQGFILVAAIMAKRKRGLWVCIREGVAREAAFSDLNAVAKRHAAN